MTSTEYPDNPRPEQTSSSEQKAGLVKEALEQFDLAVETSANLRSADDRFARIAQNGLEPILKEVDSNPKEIGYTEVEETTHNLRREIQSHLAAFDQEFNKVGADTKNNRPQIESLLQQATQETDSARAQDIKKKAILLFKSTIDQIESQQEPMHTIARVIRDNADDNQVLAHHLHRQLENSSRQTLVGISYNFDRNSRKFANLISEAYGQLNAEERRAFGQMGYRLQKFLHIVEDLIKTRTTPSAR